MPKSLPERIRRPGSARPESHPEYLETTVEFSLGALAVRRVYRVYGDTPAIACDTYLKGRAAGALAGDRAANLGDRKNIESKEDMRALGSSSVLDRFNPGGFHWQTRIVEFQDVTDWNNNLVFETDVIPYRKTTTGAICCSPAAGRTTAASFS